VSNVFEKETEFYIKKEKPKILKLESSMILKLNQQMFGLNYIISRQWI
jgi:hypothetical protein